MKLVYTHNGTFHADEVTAIAILQIFKPNVYKIARVPHQTTEFPVADYIIDIGREYDNVTKFDHHQWEGGLSSAGLIWEHIGQQDQYHEISELIQAVDYNDVGIKPAAKWEYSRLISLFNHSDIHSERQYDYFMDAVQFAAHMIAGLKDRQDALNQTRAICSNAPYWSGTTSILELPEYRQGWGTFINGETMPHIEAIVWPDHTLGTWNIQTTNKSTTSYDKVGRKLLACDKAEFVHANGFFAVTLTKELMAYYINNYLG